MSLTSESTIGTLRGGRGWTWQLLAWVLLAIGVGLLLRLRVALNAPWYGDEGYVAELAQALGRGGRPSVGGLWHDGFFPLSTSWIAPWSATPLALFPGWTGMLGVRLWALLWEGVCLAFLALLGARWASPKLGVWAVVAYALLPFAVQFGGRAFYHHFAAAFMLGGMLVGQRTLETGRVRDTVMAGLALGLSVATCYWLWWLPATWLLLLGWRQPRRFWLGLLSAGFLPVVVLSVQALQNPSGAAWSIASLLQASTVGSPKGAAAWAEALAANLGSQSFLILGLLGMAWAVRSEPKRWAWPALALLLAILEPVRQRGNIAGAPYPFMLAAPLAALGIAVLAQQTWRRPWARVLSVVLAVAWLRPMQVLGLELRSFEPNKLAELQGFFQSQSDHRGVICGLPSFNWALRPSWQVCEPFDVALYDHRPSAYFAANAPRNRFAHPCGLSSVRYAVMTRQHFVGHFRFEGVALTFLEMEQQQWPLVYDGRAFKVYENPAFGAVADPKADLLQSADNYVLAAAQAHRAGLLAQERYAQARAKALGYRL